MTNLRDRAMEQSGIIWKATMEALSQIDVPVTLAEIIANSVQGHFEDDVSETIDDDVKADTND